jgi:excisionase family DNA binding protein
VLGLVSIIVLFVPAPSTAPLPESAARKGCAVAAHSKAATTYPSYLHTAEVADILHVSPKTVSRWAKEGKLPFLKTLGGHRRYPEAEIRELAEGLREGRPPNGPVGSSGTADPDRVHRLERGR